MHDVVRLERRSRTSCAPRPREFARGHVQDRPALTLGQRRQASGGPADGVVDEVGQGVDTAQVAALVHQLGEALGVAGLEGARCDAALLERRRVSMISFSVMAPA